MPIEIYRNPRVTAYLQVKHLELLNDYRTPDGQYTQACSLIAVEIAKLILETGERPYLASVRGGLLPDGLNREVLTPRIYEGRVRWGGHVICCVESTVLDPMIGKPLLITEYETTVFQQPVEVAVKIPANTIEEFINR